MPRSHGVTVDAQLSPGDSVSYRFVITFPSIYTLTTQYSGGSLAIAISSANPDLTIPVDPGKPDGVDVTNDITLTPGVYQLQLTANGSQPVLAHLVLGTPAISVESILQSGIGQGPGLSLRLIAPVVVLTSQLLRHDIRAAMPEGADTAPDTDTHARYRYSRPRRPRSKCRRHWVSALAPISLAGHPPRRISLRRSS